MENEEKQGVSADPFEDGLREILTHESINSSMQSDAGRASAPNAEPRGMSARGVGRMSEKEKKALFWFNLLRPAAFLALVGLLIWYVYRVFIN